MGAEVAGVGRRSVFRLGSQHAQEGYDSDVQRLSSERHSRSKVAKVVNDALGGRGGVHQFELEEGQLVPLVGPLDTAKDLDSRGQVQRLVLELQAVLILEKRLRRGPIGQEGDRRVKTSVPHVDKLAAAKLALQLVIGSHVEA
jgi:hypothetical protein